MLERTPFSSIDRRPVYIRAALKDDAIVECGYAQIGDLLICRLDDQEPIASVSKDDIFDHQGMHFTY